MLGSIETDGLIDPNKHARRGTCCGHSWRVVALCVGALVLVTCLAIMTGVLVHESSRWTLLESSILSDNIMPRLAQLEQIARANNGSR